MPFGPFLSQEEKDKINAAHRKNYGPPERPARETPQQVAERLNTGRKYSGYSYSVLNGKLVSRQDKYHAGGETDWNGNPINSSYKGTDFRSGGRSQPMMYGGGGMVLPAPEMPELIVDRPSAQTPVETGKDYTVNGITYDGKTHRPKGAPEGGYSVGKDGKMTPHTKVTPPAEEPATQPPGGDTPPASTPPASTPPAGGDTRVSPTGLVSYGRDLSSLNQFTKAFTGGYELTDLSTAFKSNDLPTASQKGTNTDYSVDDAVAMGMPQEDALTIEGGGSVETTFSPDGSVTTQRTPGSAQEGASDKPDVAEKIRTVRMRRQGPRDEGSPRGFRRGNFGGEEPDNSSLVSPMYANSKRNAIRSAFLDLNKSSVQASVAANAIAGYGKDSDGNARFNVGGKLVYAKDGMQQQAKNAAMMGLDPREFLDVPATEDTKPDTPAPAEISPEPAATQQFKGLEDQPESVQNLVSMTQAPLMSADMPEFKDQKEADAFLSGWKKKAGLTQ